MLDVVMVVKDEYWASLDYRDATDPHSRKTISWREAMQIPQEGVDDEGRIERIVGAIRQLISRLDLPDRLEPLGVRRADLAAMASYVMQEASLEFNPRPVRDDREVIALLEAAL